MKVDKLILQSNNFLQQYQFYVDKLGLDLIDKNDDSFSVQAGSSTLEFIKSTYKCYYHFAFNIFPFQIMEALNWAQQRINFLQYEGKTILDFPNWNAKAFYFFDSDKNIVEFIDRRNLKVKNGGAFSVKNVLEISEVGLPVHHVHRAFQMLNVHSGIQKYSGDYEKFCAAGDEHGLFIIVNQNTKTWLPTDIPAKAFPFELDFFNDQEKYFLKFNGKEYAIGIKS